MPQHQLTRIVRTFFLFCAAALTVQGGGFVWPQNDNFAALRVKDLPDVTAAAVSPKEAVRACILANIHEDDRAAFRVIFDTDAEPPDELSVWLERQYYYGNAFYFVRLVAARKGSSLLLAYEGDGNVNHDVLQNAGYLPQPTRYVFEERPVPYAAAKRAAEIAYWFGHVRCDRIPDVPLRHGGAIYAASAGEMVQIRKGTSGRTLVDLRQLALCEQLENSIENGLTARRLACNASAAFLWNAVRSLTAANPPFRNGCTSAAAILARYDHGLVPVPAGLVGICADALGDQFPAGAEALLKRVLDDPPQLRPLPTEAELTTESRRLNTKARDLQRQIFTVQAFFTDASGKAHCDALRTGIQGILKKRIANAFEKARTEVQPQFDLLNWNMHFDDFVFLTNRVALALDKVRAGTNPDALAAFATDGRPETRWALLRLRSCDTNRYYAVLADLFRKAPDSGKPVLFAELRPNQRLAFAKDSPPGAVGPMTDLYFDTLRKAGTVPDQDRRIQALLAVARTETDSIKWNDAVSLLVPAEDPLRYRAPEIDAMLTNRVAWALATIKELRPRLFTNSDAFRTNANCNGIAFLGVQCLALRDSPGAVELCVKEAERLNDRVIQLGEASFYYPLVNLALHHPAEHRGQLLKFLRARLDDANPGIDFPACSAAYLANLVELKPLIARLATTKTNEGARLLDAAWKATNALDRVQAAFRLLADRNSILVPPGQKPSAHSRRIATIEAKRLVAPLSAAERKLIRERLKTPYDRHSGHLGSLADQLLLFSDAVHAELEKENVCD